MDQKGIDRINELARKAKTQELTPEEKKEQHKLRKEFIASVRMNLRSQLDNINIQEKDGSITNLGENMEAKKAIRKEIFRRRKETDPASICKNSAKIWQKLFSLPAFQESDWIYLYIDCKNEVMTDGIIKEAFRLGKKVAAPKVVGEDMIFYQISQPEDLEPGYFGIREPKTSLPVADGEDGLMIMPGVAFDNQRHRVGYGGGFYDRYLSKHTSHFTAALAFEFQMMEEVPTEPTDLLPDVVITEKTIYR